MGLKIIDGTYDLGFLVFFFYYIFLFFYFITFFYYILLHLF